MRYVLEVWFFDCLFEHVLKMDCISYVLIHVYDFVSSYCKFVVHIFHFSVVSKGQGVQPAALLEGCHLGHNLAPGSFVCAFYSLPHIVAVQQLVRIKERATELA